MTMQPQRVQRRRVKGWRKPDNTVIVDRTSKWGNRFFGPTYGLARVPARDGSPWEYETRISAPGMDHTYVHPNNPDGTPGRVTQHSIRLLTREESVQVFRQGLLSPVQDGPSVWWFTPEDVMAELAGKNLACPCPLDGRPCHADVLLEVANAVRLIRCMHPKCLWSAPVSPGRDLSTLDGWTNTNNTGWRCPRHPVETKENPHV